MPVIVRDATADDARTIAQVHIEAWRWAYRGQLPDDYLDDLSVGDRQAAWAAWFLSDEPRSFVLVAEGEDDRIVGFVGAGPSGDDGAPDTTGEVRAIYVLQDVQGTGVGARLLEGTESRLRGSGFDRATLWVLGTNELARRFYERKGWTWDGTTSDHRFECANRPILRYAREL